MVRSSGVTHLDALSLFLSPEERRAPAGAAIRVQGLSNGPCDCPELRHVTNSGTLTAQNPRHAGSVLHNQPGSLLLWQPPSSVSTHVTDRGPLPTAL